MSFRREVVWTCDRCRNESNTVMHKLTLTLNKTSVGTHLCENCHKEFISWFEAPLNTNKESAE